MKKKTSMGKKKNGYVCGSCGSQSYKAEKCCGQSMKTKK